MYKNSQKQFQYTSSNTCSESICQNYTMLLNKINNLNKVRVIPWIGKLKILKMSILFKLICRLDAIPIKIPTRFFINISISKIYMLKKNNYNNK